MSDQDLKNEDFFDIGKVINAHGVRGQIKVFPLTFDVQRFELLDTIDVYFEKNNRVQTFTIENLSYHKNLVLIKLKEINDMNEALGLKNGLIRIPRDMALPLSENEYYVKDLIGLQVYKEDGELLGTLDEVIETGANDVYRIGELLIPAIKQCILSVDIASKVMKVHLLEGLE